MKLWKKTKVLYSVYLDMLIVGKTCVLLEQYRKQTTQEYFATQAEIWQNIGELDTYIPLNFISLLSHNGISV